MTNKIAEMPLMQKASQVLSAVHLVDIGQVEESERREHQDADAGTEITPINGDQKLADHDEAHVRQLVGEALAVAIFSSELLERTKRLTAGCTRNKMAANNTSQGTSALKIPSSS